MAGYTLSVDGVDTSPARPASAGGGLSLDWNSDGSASLSFAVFDTGTGTITPSVDMGDLVALTDTDSGDQIFGGFVHRMTSTVLQNSPTGTLTVLRSIEAVDYSSLVRRRLINKSYAAKSLAFIVDDIITTYLAAEGITAGTIDTGPTFTSAIFSQRSAEQALDELSDAAGFIWFVNPDKTLDFIDRGTSVASFSVSASSRDFRSCTVVDSLEDYANKYTVRGGLQVSSDQAEVVIGDGQRRVFNVSFPLAQKPTSIEVDVGAGYVTVAAGDIGIRGLDSGKEWYWSKGQTELEQDAAETVLSVTDTVRVTYAGLFPVVAVSESTSEIAARAAASSGTSGIFERLEVDASLETLDMAADRANGLLRRFGTIPQSIQLETDNTTIRPGQLVTVTLPELNISGDFLCDRVQMFDAGGGVPLIRTRATLLSGETLGGWSRFWKRLTQPDRLNVGDELLVMVLTQSETLSITSSAETVTSPYTAPWHTFDVTEYGWSSIFLELLTGSTPAQFDVSIYNDGHIWT
jgi:hypothetical protein